MPNAYVNSSLCVFMEGPQSCPARSRVADLGGPLIHDTESLATTVEGDFCGGDCYAPRTIKPTFLYIGKKKSRLIVAAIQKAPFFAPTPSFSNAFSKLI